jgi:anionic cell wall polymer biosynthesis LytR-Cps2A-Psr (LCP) family protein
LQEYAGYRTQKRRSREKKKRSLWKWLIALAVVIVILVILGAGVRVYPFNRAWDKTADGFTWLGRKIKGVFVSGKTAAPQKFLEEGKKTANYLIGVTTQQGGATVMSTIIVASYDSRDKTGSLIYFPSDMNVQVPGAGEDQLANLVQLDDGRFGMTLVAVSNLLGAEIDRYVLATDRDVRIILGKLDQEYKVDVPTKVSFTDDSLGVKVDLDPGKQEISYSELAAYLTYAPEGKEIELIRRQMAFAPEFLSVSSGIYNEIPAFTRRYANLVDTSASDRQLAGFCQAFSQLKGSSLQQASVPVKEVRIEKTVMHILDPAKLDAFKKKYLKTDTAFSDRFKVEILNGNGVPGVGQSVASSLNPAEFRVVNNDNADNFLHPDTVILCYTTDRKVVSAAERIKNALGVGRIEFRSPNQNVVDITIVVGKDYPKK